MSLRSKTTSSLCFLYVALRQALRLVRSYSGLYLSDRERVSVGLSISSEWGTAATYPVTMNFLQIESRFDIHTKSRSEFMNDRNRNLWKLRAGVSSSVVQ